MRIRDMKLDIPMPSRPVYWNTDLDVDVNLAVLGRYISTYTEKLPLGEGFDEAAVLLPNPYLRRLFVDKLVAAGWEYFNQSEDVVYTNPFGTRYCVSYQFLRKAGVPYRIEAMVLETDELGDPGFSPLHRALWQTNGDPTSNNMLPVPHLSFKPTPRVLRIPAQVAAEAGRPGSTRTVQTLGQAYSSAVAHLQEQACIHAQTCQSSYGRFGYFLPNDATRQLYIKPRINTRDDA